MTKPTRELTLSEHILHVLGQSILPITTADLVAIVAAGKSNARARVWQQLRYLKRVGLVVGRRGKRSPGGPRTSNRGGHIVTRWRLAD